MVPDVEKHEEKKMQFLGALYDIAQDHIKNQGDVHDPVKVREFRAVIAQRAGLADGESQRIGAELARQDLVETTRDLSPDPEKGELYSLTQYGLEAIENHLHEKHRPWHDRLRENLGSPAIIGGLAGLITSLLVNVLSASDMPWWLKLLLARGEKIILELYCNLQ